MTDIYCDNAATTVKKPLKVAEAVYEALASGELGNPARGAHEFSLSSYRKVSQVREKLKKLLQASSNYEIVFTNNATTSLNLVIQGLLKPNDHVLVTSWEHNAVLRPLYSLEKKGVQFDYVSSQQVTGILNYAEFERKIKPETVAVIVNHGSNVTGNIADLEWLKSFCEEKKLWLILDISQSFGQLPVSLSDEKITAVCFTGHKSLYGPTGTGGICLKKELELTPLLTGGDGIYSFEKEPPKEYPVLLEAGTLNVPGIIGLGAGLDYLFETGIAEINDHLSRLTQTFIDGLKKVPNIIVYGDLTVKKLPVISLNVQEISSTIISDILWEEYRIATRPSFHCSPLMHQALGTQKQGTVRFSFSNFNTLGEINTCLQALEEISRR